MKILSSFVSFDYIPANEQERVIAYYKLGVISTAFASLEQGLFDILLAMMRFDTPLGLHLIERNNMEANLQLLDKFNKHLKLELIKELTEEIGKIKKHRNNLIHGSWNIYRRYDEEGLFISVKSHRLTHNPGHGTRPDFWEEKTVYEYGLTEFDELIETIRELEQLEGSIYVQLVQEKPKF